MHKTSKTSKTAILAASVRAYHYEQCKSPVFSDEYAVDMVPVFWRVITKNRLLGWFVVHKVFHSFRPVHTEVILRARFAEDHLIEAISRGVGQYVILGAGLDTFSIRHRELADTVRIFELDHPATQATKEKQVRAVNGGVPSNLVFVPIDFETDHLNEALIRAGFEPEKPTFFSWLGTTYYITKDAIRETLGRIADVAAPGSSIAFYYKLARHLIPEGSLLLADRLDRFVARRGEPMLSVFTPEELNDEMSRIGFGEIETLPSDEQKRRYLRDSSDLVDPAPNFSFALFGVRKDCV
ncbi:MAG: SAM-dependent methyltransferase [Opitutae bacterium]|nr:SAM-dependent methyltransferase [Opitutae bacterium]